MSVHIFSWDCMNKRCDTIHPYAGSSSPQTAVCRSHAAAPFCCYSSTRTEERNKLNCCTMTKCLQIHSQWDLKNKKSDKSSSESCSKSSSFFRLQLTRRITCHCRVGDNHFKSGKQPWGAVKLYSITEILGAGTIWTLGGATSKVLRIE